MRSLARQVYSGSVTLSAVRINPNIFGTARYAIALALMLWCAGTGCVLVSYAHAAMMSDAHSAAANSAKQSWGGIETGASSHGSCHAAHSRSNGRPSNSNSGAATVGEQIALPTMPVSPGAMNCCPLASGSIVTTSRAQTNDDGASFSASDALASFTYNISTPAPLAAPLRLPNRSKVYLLDCSFLI